MKYCDYLDEMKMKAVQEDHIIDVCEEIEMILISYNQKTL